MLYSVSHLSFSPPADISTVVCAANKVSTLIQQAPSCPSLRTIITMGDKVTEEEKQQISQAGLEIYTMAQIEV